VTQRVQPLLASLEKLVSQQAQLSSRLNSQAEQIQATRQALLELQSRVAEQPVVETTEMEFVARPMTVEDPREVSIVSLDDDAEPMFATDSSIDRAPVERNAAPIPQDDRLLHFVSGRLAELDSGRQRWIAIYWAIALASVGILGVVTWALWSWLSGQSAGG
jgi:hypothetical protein